MLVSVENYNIYMRYFSTDNGGAENEHCQEHKKELKHLLVLTILLEKLKENL